MYVCMYVCCRWKQFQAPTGFPRNNKEVTFSDWLKSIRKDVECGFGILKKRFRCLKLPFTVKNIKEIEYIFVTCCMLHNMLLDIRLGSLHGGWSQDEVIPPTIRDPLHPEIVMRVNDKTNYFSRVHQFGVQDGCGTDYQEWRDRFINHFYYMFVRKLHKWTGPLEPNSSMFTPMNK